MNHRKEKAAGVLDTPTTASKDQCPESVSAAEKTGKPEAKQYATLQAQFALLGRTLTRAHRAHDGRISYAVTRWSESRYFSHLNDVQAHLNALGGRP